MFAPTPAGAATPITGGGSGFAALEIDQWRADTARAPFSLKVDYVSQGSTFGRTQFAQGNLDFGASDQRSTISVQQAWKRMEDPEGTATTAGGENMKLPVV